MKGDKRFLYFIIGVMTALFLNAIACSDRDRFGNADSNDKTEIDTVYIDRIVEVPGKTGSFTDSIPDPEIVYKADPDLLANYESLETENERLKAFIDAITVRTYEQTYVSADSIVKITVKDSVTGTLDFQSVLFDIAPQKVVIQEREITKTVEKYPDFILSLGAGIKVPTNFMDPMGFEGVIGIKDKKGFNYELGIDTRREVRFTLTKDLFTKF